MTTVETIGVHLARITNIGEKAQEIKCHPLTNAVIAVLLAVYFSEQAPDLQIIYESPDPEAVDHKHVKHDFVVLKHNERHIFIPVQLLRFDTAVSIAKRSSPKKPTRRHPSYRSPAEGEQQQLWRELCGILSFAELRSLAQEYLDLAKTENMFGEDGRLVL